MEGIKVRLYIARERTGELEDIAMETNQNKAQEEKENNKKETKHQ